MKIGFSGTRCALALAVAGMLTFGTAMADKPAHAGGGKGKHVRSDKGGHSDQRGHSDRRDHSDRREHQKSERHASDHGSPHAGDRHDHFGDRHRTFVHDYYSGQHRAGRCPPGLAKKHNGCMPPGQAKKWHHGQPLARGVTVYPVPRSLLSQLGQPPAGYRYVRVGSDILLMQHATRNIVDSIQDLGRS